MITADSKKNEIMNSPSAIIAIVLLAIYFINDFFVYKQLVIAGIYAGLIVLSVFLCSKKENFYEVVYILFALFVLGEILKNYVLYYTTFEQYFVKLIDQFAFPTGAYVQSLLSTPL